MPDSVVATAINHDQSDGGLWLSDLHNEKRPTDDNMEQYMRHLLPEGQFPGRNKKVRLILCTFQDLSEVN